MTSKLDLAQFDGHTPGLIARIYKGHRIQHGTDQYDVIGSRKLRGAYFYIVRDVNGCTFSMRREFVLSGQQSGEIKVS